MTTAVRDTRTMLRRSTRRMIRYPSLTVMLVALPIVFLLLFVYVFGETLGSGLGGGGGRGAYLDYVTPGILLMTIAAAVNGTSISVAMDMTEGIIDRFRTMAISRSAVLAGHVLGSMIQTLGSIALVLGVAVLLGFRPDATPVEWLAAAGLVTAFALALIWLAVAMGLGARSVETASNSPMIFTLLPFLGSGFVPTESMPGGLRLFADHQPFTPVIETLRGLLTGTPVGTGRAAEALAWCAALTVLGYLWSRRTYERRTER